MAKTHALVVLPAARRDIDRVDAWLWLHHPEQAARWLEEIGAALQSLSVLPERCPLVPEVQVRGKAQRALRVGSHRVIFRVEAGQVRVLRIRHQSQRPLGKAK